MTRHFQTTVIITAALYTAFFFMPQIWHHIYAEEVVNILSMSGTGGTLESTSPIPYIYSMLYILSLLGLYTYRTAAKWLFIILIAYNFLVSPYLTGISVSMYLDTSIGYLLTLFEGALIVMLYSDGIEAKLT